jgi:hypothetical protein
MRRQSRIESRSVGADKVGVRGGDFYTACSGYVVVSESPNVEVLWCVFKNEPKAHLSGAPEDFRDQAIVAIMSIGVPSF